MIKTLKHSSALCVAFLIALIISPAMTHAESDEVIAGLAVVQDCGAIVVNGQKITLWGIDTLAPDQQCWQNDRAWDCGAQAVTALRHLIDGLYVECQIKEHVEGEDPLALCTKNQKETQQDIGEHLIRQGLAMEAISISDGAYSEAEYEASADKRGIWSGRFQTAHDWREGIQCFVGEAPCAFHHQDQE